MAVMDRNRRTSPIDKHFLAGFVFLPEHYVELGTPALVQLAEARVAITLRVPLPVFLPQQLQGHVLAAAQLLVDRGEVGWRARRILLRDVGFPARERQRFYPRLIPVLRQRAR